MATGEFTHITVDKIQRAAHNNVDAREHDHDLKIGVDVIIVVVIMIPKHNTRYRLRDRWRCMIYRFVPIVF